MTSRMQGLDSAAVRCVQAAGQALDAGRLAQAQTQLEQLAPGTAGHPEVLRLRAGILGTQGQHRDAVALMREALRQRPDDPIYHNTMGTLLGQAGDCDAAIDSLRRSCELQSNLAMAWYNLGVMLTRAVRNDEAIAALEQATRLDSRHMEARALLADLLRMSGHAVQAGEQYREILRLKPWAGMAWWGLADLRTEPFSHADIAQMKAALQRREATDDDLIAIGFALARACDQAGQLEAALAALAQANALARGRRRWDRRGYSQAVEALNRAFDPPPPAADEALGSEVIFIVGLPRSGSTLVEQILASHPQVEGAGELPDLPQVLAEESRRRDQPFPQWVAAMQPADWARLGRRYLERTARWRRERPVSTDKLPSNWIYVGAIAAMLPGARIVGCRRDALETCFSCYRQRLDNNEYSRDFDDLASFWRDCDRSLVHWQRLHPQQVLLHDHERLVDAPEAGIRTLLNFCGLGFDPACLRFHENPREVRSPSATQVRRPIQRNSSRARVYGRLLNPLRQALNLPSVP